MLKNLRYLLTSFSLVITHFVVLGLFLAGVIPNVSSRDPFIYSLLLTVVGGIALYISYFSFYVFRKTKGVQMLVISSGFFVLGASYLLFTLSGPDFNFLGIFKAVFSLAENYGVFFGSAMMLFLLVPLDNFKERIYSHRLEVFLSIVVIYSFTLFIVILKPEYVATLQGASSVFLGSACIFLLLIFIFLFHQYREVGSRFLINLFTGVILFTTSIIISFFDDRNNLFWWYGQATVLVSFLIILVGFILAQWEEKTFNIIEGEMPVYSKIGTKLLGSFLLVAALSVFLTGYFSFTSAKESLKKQLYNNLDLTVEDKEVKVLDFIANTKKEVVDIATNQALINIFKNNHTVSASNANDSIAEYLRKAKSTFYEIDVLDNNGNVISSTNTKAVKENRLKESFFSLSNNFGKNEAYISDVYLANDKIPTILTASNIIDKDSDEKLGKVVGYKSAIFLDAALSEFALEKNYSIGDISNSGNFETYLINRTGYLIVETSFARGKILEQQSVTKAFSSCQYGERIIDEYKDYRNVDVVGASKCLKNGWTLVSELSVDDAYSSLEIIKIKILLASLAIVVFVFIMVYFLIKKITDPIKNLIQVVKNIGQGDYSKKADTKEEGEMGMLAESFNLMTDNIIKTNKSIQEQNSQLKEASEELEGAKNSLEAKVKKRTLELEESKVYLEQKVEERTVELKKLNNKLETEVSNRTKELKEKLVELERFNKLAVGRELKMIELKEELKRNKKVPSHRKLT